MIDTYTKIILTIIAVCLIFITFKLATPQAVAGSTITNVCLKSIGYHNLGYKGLPVYLTKPVEVKIKK